MQTVVGKDQAAASSPTLCRFENCSDRTTAVAVQRIVVEQFIASFAKAPEELVLDFDATDDLVHGSRQGDNSAPTTTTTASCRCTSSAANNRCFLFTASKVRRSAAYRSDLETAHHATAPNLARGAHHLSWRLRLRPPAIAVLVRTQPDVLRHRHSQEQPPVGRQRALARTSGASLAGRRNGIPTKYSTLSKEVNPLPATASGSADRLR